MVAVYLRNGQSQKVIRDYDIGDFTVGGDNGAYSAAAYGNLDRVARYIFRVISVSHRDSSFDKCGDSFSYTSR